MLVTTMRHLALLLAFDSIICVDGKAWSKKNNFADDGAEDLDSGALKDFKVAQNDQHRIIFEGWEEGPKSVKLSRWPACLGNSR
jgi:hypothetical protein